jgi:hypothetical protein
MNIRISKNSLLTPHKFCRLLIVLLFPVVLIAQNDSVKYDITISGLSSTGRFSPFWLQTNQYGKISSSPSSVNLLAGISKDFRAEKNGFQYGFKANALIQSDRSRSTVYLHELYFKARLFVFDFMIGSREEQFGVQDSSLSSGGFLFSENARPLPKITLGIERFTPIPFTKNFLEIKGAISNCWVENNKYIQNEYIHHKYAYLRIGGKLSVHLQYGIDHTALWGGYIKGIGQQPADLDAFHSIFFVAKGGQNASQGEQVNALGDHRISQNLKLEIAFSTYKIAGYWENFSEDGPVRFMTSSMNKTDGLWGISFRNTSFPLVKAIVYEYLNTSDQSGPYLQKDGIIYGGGDSYFTNYIYYTGWNNYSRTLGTPFITSPLYNKNGEPYTLNNRVQVHHFGAEGSAHGYNYRTFASFSRNYGTYSNPMNVNNISTMLEVNKRFQKLSNIELSCSLGSDWGKLYGNSMGVLFSIRKSGQLFHY